MKASAPRAILLVDLGFGDAGKGTMVDYLVRRHSTDLVVRFNGGPQAGHNVVLPDGRHHTFSQFGSGVFVPGVRTLLSRYMLIEPYAMLNEAEHLASLGVADAMQRTAIDQRCLVIGPPQQALNQLREQSRGPTAHGTCGRGVGEAVADAIALPELAVRAEDLRDGSRLRRKLRALLDYKRDQAEEFRAVATAEQRRILDDPAWIDAAVAVGQAVAARARIVSPDETRSILRSGQCTIFEAAQGVLLDERFGFHPHTTWSTCTFTNADELLEDAGVTGPRQRIGVMRIYMTRHGPGPFPTEMPSIDIPEPHNADAGWQGRFRRGVLDLVLLRYAINACGGVDGLAITHLDRLSMLPPLACERYARGNPPAAACPMLTPWPSDSADVFIAAVERALHVPIIHRSHGPTWREKD